MKDINKFFDFPKNQTISIKNERNTISIFFSEMKPKRNVNKNKYSTIRKNLLSITKEDIKNSKILFTKSYKEDLDLEILNTTHSLNINTENYNHDILEPNNEEILDLEDSKNKYADKDCSSSNMSD